MSLQPQSSDRNKGQTRAMALEAMSQLPPEVLASLGPAGQKALERLCKVAPGTYFHSQEIAHLMPENYQTPEYQAAVLLHDLGKVHYPPFYGENMSGASQRPKVDILHAHVDGGATLAEYYNLPPLARDAILEHHGTMPTLGEELPYQGRRPRSMFTAVLMMTDKIEAITSGGKFSESLVWKIYQDCQARGQFEFVDQDILKTYVTRAIERVAQIDAGQELAKISFEDDDLTMLKAMADPAPSMRGQALDGAALIELEIEDDSDIEL